MTQFQVGDRIRFKNSYYDLKGTVEEMDTNGKQAGICFDTYKPKQVCYPVMEYVSLLSSRQVTIEDWRL